MSALEARYRRLLRVYPDWYRLDRGEEMLDTLLEAASPGRAWPTARDTRALILGGLQVRARHGQQLTPAASLRQTVLLAAELTHAPQTAFEFGAVRGEWGYAFPSMLSSWVNLILGVLTLAAAVGAWFGRRAVVAAAAVACAGLSVYQSRGLQLPQVAEAVLAIMVVAILVIRRERLPRSWLCLAGTVFAVYLVPWVFPEPGLPLMVANYGGYAILSAAIVWSVVDARPLAAAALFVAVDFGAASIRLFARQGVHIYLWFVWLPAVIAIAVSISAVWRVRRQAVL